MDQSHKQSFEYEQLESLLDKLVAVQIDLRILRGAAVESAQVIAPRASIAGACKVLTSAIGDLRTVIRHVDNVTERRESRPYRDYIERAVSSGDSAR